MQRSGVVDRSEQWRVRALVHLAKREGWDQVKWRHHPSINTKRHDNEPLWEYRHRMMISSDHIYLERERVRYNKYGAFTQTLLLGDTIASHSTKKWIHDNWRPEKE